jgi:four helix bundle protein
MFIAESVSLELVQALRPLVLRIKRCDRSLADQLTRAASSITLNIAEANYSDPGNRKSRFFTAAGSANETRAALTKRAQRCALPLLGDIVRRNRRRGLGCWLIGCLLCSGSLRAERGSKREGGRLCAPIGSRRFRQAILFDACVN